MLAGLCPQNPLSMKFLGTRDKGFLQMCHEMMPKKLVILELEVLEAVVCRCSSK